jgi:hypothetical protein
LSRQLNLPQSDLPIYLQHPETDLLQSQLRDSSPLTTLTTSSLLFLDQMITSSDLIAKYSMEYTLSELVTVYASSEETQTQLLDTLIHNEQSWKKRSDDQWKMLRQSCHWLRTQSGVLGKISPEHMDTMILNALLDATCIFLLPHTVDCSI